MYNPDNLDRVVQSREAPPPEAGAPLPLVVADEQSVFLAYVACSQAKSTPNWSFPQQGIGVPYEELREVSWQTEKLPIAIVRFDFPYAVMFGAPNDEALHGHPLFGRGLTFYSVSEIMNSSWVRGLQHMNSTHRNHHPEFFADLRHFIFTFHDSTFEAVAKGIEVDTMIGSIRAARTVISKKLEQMR